MHARARTHVNTPSPDLFLAADKQHREGREAAVGEWLSLIAQGRTEPNQEHSMNPAIAAGQQPEVHTPTSMRVVLCCECVHHVVL